MAHRPPSRLHVRMPLQRRNGRIEVVSPIHRPRASTFTRFGPEDPAVVAAFPHVPPRMLRAAHLSWRALATLIHPPGRRLVRRLVEGADLPRIDVPVPALERGFDGYTIAFISDVHAGPYLSADVLAPLFARVSRERPDLIVLGGDLINYDADEIEEVAAAMKHLHAREGILSVPGNHDHYSRELPRLLRRLEAAGARTLVNDAADTQRRGDRLALLGVDDGGAGRFDLARARARARDTRVKLLFSHTPDALPLAAHAGIDLVVSGHTHGGQLRAPGVRPLSTHTKGRYVDGFYRVGRTSAFVGRGVGVVCVPLRTFCPPHVPILTLRSVEPGSIEKGV